MLVEFDCPQCGKKMRIGDEYAGQLIACPRCEARQFVPGQRAAESAPEPPATPRPSRAKTREAPLATPLKKIDVEELIDMTAMVDVVFFLLIFFLVTSMKAIDSSIPMPAPDPQKESASQQAGASSVAADDDSIIVRIDRDDSIWLEGAEIRNQRELLFKLRELRSGASRPEKMLVVGHGDATHGTTVMVLDSGHEVGMEHVKLAVADETE